MGWSQVRMMFGRICPKAFGYAEENGGNKMAGIFETDRKSTRLNSSHEWISYAVFCLKKKITTLEHVPLLETDHPSRQEDCASLPLASAWLAHPVRLTCLPAKLTWPPIQEAEPTQSST